MTLSRGDLLHVAKRVLFKTTGMYTRDESEESQDRHWQLSNMAQKNRLLAGLAQGLSEVGIEVEERRTRTSTSSKVSSL